MTVNTQDLRELLEKATPGPWIWKQIGSYSTPGVALFWSDTSKGGVHYRRLDSNGGLTEADADLITNAVRALPALLAENEALSKQVEELRAEGAAAVRWAPSSAHWSCQLKRLFGDDARQGIDALERRLRDAQAENDALRGERAVLADILRDALGPLRVDLMNAEADGDGEDARDLRAIIDRADAALNPPAPPQGDGAC